jgi:hypothetical protein
MHPAFSYNYIQPYSKHSYVYLLIEFALQSNSTTSLIRVYILICRQLVLFFCQHDNECPYDWDFGGFYPWIMGGID